MTTTIMRDSTIGDDWIKRACEANPIQRVMDANGQPTDNFLTGPVRLSFPNLFKPQEPQKGDAEGEGKHNATLLFTPYADFSLLYQEYYRLCAKDFPEYYDATSQQYHGLHSPFNDQAQKCAKYTGYTPGLVYMSCGSKFRPPVVDIRMNPIVDENRVYAGVWAIASINAYSFSNKKKGVSFGLQSVVIIADDENLGGGAPDPKQQFSGIQVQPPAGQPSQMFGQPGAGAPPGAPLLPGQTPPGAPSAPPGAPVPPAAPMAPAAAPQGEDCMFCGAANPPGVTHCMFCGQQIA